MGGVPIFKIPSFTLQLDGLHLRLMMNPKLTLSSSSQSPHHLISLWKFLGRQRQCGVLITQVDKDDSKNDTEEEDIVDDEDYKQKDEDEEDDDDDKVVKLASKNEKHFYQEDDSNVLINFDKDKDDEELPKS